MNFAKALKTLASFWKGAYWKGVSAEDCATIDVAFASLSTLAAAGPTVIGAIEHPVHGGYVIHYSEGCYGISRSAEPVHCGYASLAALFQAKGL